ncbi:MAG: hypothetical protein CME69_00140 [Halobacteriovorax sp.]|nr:hypothetical protein [Halobacteriovorax sp.]
MVVLRIIIFIFISSFAFAKTEVFVFCENTSLCADYSEDLKRKLLSVSPGEIENTISFELENPVIKSFVYTMKDDNYYIEVSLKKRISQVSFTHENESITGKIEEEFNVRGGDIFNEDKVGKEFESLKTQAETLVGGNVSLNIFENSQNDIEIRIDVSNKSQGRLKKINFLGVNNTEEKDLARIYNDIYNQRYSKNDLKQRLSLVNDYFVSKGFWSVVVTEDILKKEDGEELTINIKKGKRVAFYITGEPSFVTHSELKQKLQKEIRSVTTPVNRTMIVRVLNDIYKNKGVFNSSFQIREEINKDKLGEYNFFFIDIKEGQRVRLADIKFQGNFQKSNEELTKLFYEDASVLVDRGYLDLIYLDSFQDKLNEFYVKRGYVFSNIVKPVVSFSGDGDEAYITYQLTEGQSFVVGDISFKGIPFDIEFSELKKIMSNKKGKSLDVTLLDKDLANLLEYIRNQGYYFAEYTQGNTREMVKLDKITNEAKIQISINPGFKMFMGEVIVSGNIVTKNEVVLRELPLRFLDIVNPQKINSYVDRLRSLGLFSRVSISPRVGKMIGSNKALLNFVIKVKELQFGRGELTPGFRTDLGYKLGLSLGWNNIDGLNRSILLRARTNLRTSYSFFDEERRREEKRRLEALTELQFVEPYVFGTDTEFRLVFRGERRRFRKFDADIFSVSPTLSKNITNNLNFSLKYEFDDIRQYDATDEKDEERYIIGAITPSFTLDLRDNAKAPRDGAWFNLSWEFANPFFLSQEEEQLTVNYTRAVLKSFFYQPVGSIVLATSLTLGYAENFATDTVIDSSGNRVTSGIIPQLKVFRLIGSDFLRGFDDQEANRLPDSRDVADILVRDKNYLVNIKIEPRYYFGDTAAIALFYDAGRVFVDTFKPLDLRGSVGLSFKLLTPVGSLDFDLGAKTRRYRVNGQRESFGRVHVTIGQF